MNYRVPFVLAVVVLFPIICLAAQPTGIPAVPAGLSAQVTAKLNAERTKLVAQGQTLQVKVEKHHTDCAHIIGLPVESPSPEFVALERQCEAEASQLEMQTKQYAAATAIYRKDVEQALEASAGSRAAFGVRVVLKGDVKQFSPSGQSIELVSSRVVEMSSGDRLTTGPYSRLACQLPDKTQFILGPEAGITLETFVNDAKPARRHILIRVTRGVLAWQNGEVANASTQDVSVGVAAGVIAVKGAQLQVSVSPSGDGYVALFKGVVAVATKSGSMVALTPGQVARFDSRGVFGNATPIQPGEIRTP